MWFAGDGGHGSHDGFCFGFFFRFVKTGFLLCWYFFCWSAGQPVSQLEVRFDGLVILRCGLLVARSVNRPLFDGKVVLRFWFAGPSVSESIGQLNSCVCDLPRFVGWENMLILL